MDEKPGVLFVSYDGMLEPLGVPGAGDINSIAFSVWALWALALGVALLWKHKPAVISAPLAA